MIEEDLEEEEADVGGRVGVSEHGEQVRQPTRQRGGGERARRRALLCVKSSEGGS